MWDHAIDCPLKMLRRQRDKLVTRTPSCSLSLSRHSISSEHRSMALNAAVFTLPILALPSNRASDWDMGIPEQAWLLPPQCPGLKTTVPIPQEVQQAGPGNPESPQIPLSSLTVTHPSLAEENISQSTQIYPNPTIRHLGLLNRRKVSAQIHEHVYLHCRLRVACRRLQGERQDLRQALGSLL